MPAGGWSAQWSWQTPCSGSKAAGDTLLTALVRHGSRSLWWQDFGHYQPPVETSWCWWKNFACFYLLIWERREEVAATNVAWSVPGRRKNTISFCSFPGSLQRGAPLGAGAGWPLAVPLQGQRVASPCRRPRLGGRNQRLWLRDGAGCSRSAVLGPCGAGRSGGEAARWHPWDGAGLGPRLLRGGEGAAAPGSCWGSPQPCAVGGEPVLLSVTL